MKTKILIVEDDLNIRFGLKEVLQSEGFAISVCERGDHAMDAVKQEQPALVLLDIMLPGKSGYDICKELRKRKISVLILMLTAKGQEIEKVVGLELGADDYLTKPFGVRELVARIRALLRRASGIPSTSSPDSPRSWLSSARRGMRDHIGTRSRAVRCRAVRHAFPAPVTW